MFFSQVRGVARLHWRQNLERRATSFMPTGSSYDRLVLLTDCPEYMLPGCRGGKSPTGRVPLFIRTGR